MTQQKKDLIHPLFIDFGNKICEGGQKQGFGAIMDEIDDQEELKHESENVKELLGQVKQAGLDLEACVLRATKRKLCVFYPLGDS